MASLEVNNIPNDLYEEIVDMAKKENRSLNQEAIFLLRHGLSNVNEQGKKMQAIFQRINKLNLGDTSSFPSPENLVREDRDR